MSKFTHINFNHNKAEWLPALIAAGSALASGITQAISGYNQNIKNMANANKINQQNIEYQYDFAKNGIAWRKQDAINAGINPLYALGANTTSFTPNLVTSEGQDPYQALGQSVGQIGNIVAERIAQKKQNEANLANTKSNTEKEKAITDYYKALTNDIQKPKESQNVSDIIGSQNNNDLNRIYNVEKGFNLSPSGEKGVLYLGFSQENQAPGENIIENKISAFFTNSKDLIKEANVIKKRLEKQTRTRWEVSGKIGTTAGGRVKLENTGKKIMNQKEYESYVKKLSQ